MIASAGLPALGCPARRGLGLGQPLTSDAHAETPRPRRDQLQVQRRVVRVVSICVRSLDASLRRPESLTPRSCNRVRRERVRPNPGPARRSLRTDREAGWRWDARTVAPTPHDPNGDGGSLRRTSPSSERGVLVLAYGHRRYHRQAHTLAMSLQRNSPDLPRTLVTDNARCAAVRMYDQVIQLPSGQPNDCSVKLDLDRYAPYEHTLYLDADSLAIRPIEPLFDLFNDADVGVIGRDITARQEAHWYGDVAAMCRLVGTTWIPMCNSGVLLIRATGVSQQVFARARQLGHSYRHLGLDRFRNGVADEPLLSMALAEQGIHAQDLTALAAATPLGLTSPLLINLLAGRCTFAKRGVPVQPALIHFAADYSSDYRLAGAHYRRERLALRLSEGPKLPDGIARLVAGLRFGAQCAAFNTWVRIAGRAPRDPSTAARQWPPPKRADGHWVKQSPFEEESH